MTGAGPGPGPGGEWPGWWGVTIGPQQVYDKVVGVESTLSRLVDQVAAVAADVVDHETRIRMIEDVRPAPRIKDLEVRVRTVEGRLFPLPVVAMLFAAASLAVAVINLGGGGT